LGEESHAVQQCFALFISLAISCPAVAWLAVAVEGGIRGLKGNQSWFGQPRKLLHGESDYFLGKQSTSSPTAMMDCGAT
jgi:hypothetical protein